MFFNDIITEYRELKETAVSWMLNLISKKYGVWIFNSYQLLIQIGARKRITDRIQERFQELKEETEKLHRMQDVTN